MRHFQRKKAIRITAGLLALLLAASVPMSAFAAQQEDKTQTEEKLARLTDNTIEYDELFDLIKNFYGPVKSGYDTIASMKSDTEAIALEMRISADDMLDQADDLTDMKHDNPQLGAILNQSIAQVKAGVKALRKQAKSTEDGLKSFDYQNKTIDRQVNSIVQSLETLINTYYQTLANREMAQKGVELAQAAKQMQDTMLVQGMAVDSSILSAAASLSSAKQQLATLDAGLETLRENIFLLTGYGPDAQNVQIGAVPKADLSLIDAMDVNDDKEKAAINNYALISLRAQKGGATLSEVEQQLVKSTTLKRNKIRNVEYGEAQIKADVQTLYDTVLEKKAEYEAAQTAWASAQISWNGAQVQRSGGMLSDIQYRQLELAYLQAKATMECADLALQQAICNYQWEIKGVSVSV